MLDRVSLQLKSFCLFFSSVEPRLDGEEYYEFVDEFVRKNKMALISDPIFNKGLAFPMSERDRLGIRGLVPPAM